MEMKKSTKGLPCSADKLNLPVISSRLLNSPHPCEGHARAGSQNAVHALRCALYVAEGKVDVFLSHIRNLDKEIAGLRSQLHQVGSQAQRANEELESLKKGQATAGSLSSEEGGSLLLREARALISANTRLEKEVLALTSGESKEIALRRDIMGNTPPPSSSTTSIGQKKQCTKPAGKGKMAGPKPSLPTKKNGTGPSRQNKSPVSKSPPKAEITTQNRKAAKNRGRPSPPLAASTRNMNEQTANRRNAYTSAVMNLDNQLNSSIKANCESQISGESQIISRHAPKKGDAFRSHLDAPQNFKALLEGHEKSTNIGPVVKDQKKSPEKPKSKAAVQQNSDAQALVKSSFDHQHWKKADLFQTLDEICDDFDRQQKEKGMRANPQSDFRYAGLADDEQDDDFEMTPFRFSN